MNCSKRLPLGLQEIPALKILQLGKTSTVMAMLVFLTILMRQRPSTTKIAEEAGGGELEHSTKRTEYSSHFEGC
jgi:hypothetical protein